jgi:Tfp pilus assembly protein PilO
MRKIVSILLAAMLISVPAFAVNADVRTEGKDISRIEQKEHKSDLVKRYQESKEKWEALSDKQRKSVYDIQEKIDKLSLQMADRYFELGLLTEEETGMYKEHIAKRSEITRLENLIPGMRNPEKKMESRSEPSEAPVK